MGKTSSVPALSRTELGEVCGRLWSKNINKLSNITFVLKKKLLQNCTKCCLWSLGPQRVRVSTPNEQRIRVNEVMSTNLL